MLRFEYAEMLVAQQTLFDLCDLIVKFKAQSSDEAEA